ncbi:uncharacterized protein JCM15063_003151 [Sporobolomyces koalae]|uniref:uncharacterized protein n=1 Tax=Sporobolomyces koalae TaxID=500713 RepID=UPI00316B87BF
MASARDRVTLGRLVRILDDAAAEPPREYLTHLKLQTTVKHARELLEAALAQPDAEYYPPSTRFVIRLLPRSTICLTMPAQYSRNAQPPTDSLADWQVRIDRADTRLSDTWDVVSATSRPATPVDRGLDLDFLFPMLPPHMPIPRPRTKSPPPSNPAKRAEPVLLNSTSIIEDAESTTLRSSTSNLDADSLPPRPSGSSATIPPPATDLTSAGLRHRVAPPWLRHRELKEQAKAKAKSVVESKPATSADLLPADAGSTSATSSDLLSHHHALQSSLLSDLTSLSTALKTSSQTFSDNLEKDREVMQEAEKKLENNEGRIKVQQERLKGVRGKTRGTTCWTLGILAVVAAMWIGVFLLIKVT